MQHTSGPAPRPTEPWSVPEDAVDFASSLFSGRLVRLRPLRDDDVEVLQAWSDDPRYMPLQGEVVRPQPAPTRSETLRSWSRNDTSGSVGLSVESLLDGQLVGHLTLWGIEARGRCATLGLQIGGPFHGRGLGTDAARVAVRYGFAELGLHRVQLGCWSFNTRAVSAYARAGFTEEGRRRQVVFHDGHWYDEVLMSVLEEDWWARDDEDDEDEEDGGNDRGMLAP